MYRAIRFDASPGTLTAFPAMYLHKHTQLRATKPRDRIVARFWANPARTDEVDSPLDGSTGILTSLDDSSAIDDC
jgi:hypothetical protein